MIELKNTVKKFDSYTALDGVDIKIEKGTAFGLLGSNGAGKSTLLRLLAGIYKPDKGEVLIEGEKVYDNPAAKQKVFFINDETVQFGTFTLKSLKNYYKCYYPNFSEDIFKELVSRVDLPLNKKINTFSKGMKRQAIVIIALSCKTDYIFMDEAFDGLDPTMRIIVKKMLVDAMIDRGLTTVISSHNLREINEICDTAALLHNGKIIFASDIDSIMSNIHKVQLVFDNSAEKEITKESVEALGIEVLHFERNLSVSHVIIKGDADDVTEKLRSLDPIILELLPLSLEEIFIYELEVLGYDSSDIG